MMKYEHSQSFGSWAESPGREIKQSLARAQYLSLWQRQIVLSVATFVTLPQPTQEGTWQRYDVKTTPEARKEITSVRMPFCGTSHELQLSWRALVAFIILPAFWGSLRSCPFFGAITVVEKCMLIMV